MAEENFVEDGINVWAEKREENSATTTRTTVDDNVTAGEDQLNAILKVYSKANTVDPR